MSGIRKQAPASMLSYHQGFTFRFMSTNHFELGKAGGKSTLHSNTEDTLRLEMISLRLEVVECID